MRIRFRINLLYAEKTYGGINRSCDRGVQARIYANKNAEKGKKVLEN